MKKRNLMLLSLAALAVSVASAEEQATAAKIEVQATTDEQAFVAKLSEASRTVFSKMTAEQKSAVLAAAKDASLTADAAVDKVSAEAKK
jgi:hypothetical protein